MVMVQTLGEMVLRIGNCSAKTMDLDHFLEVVTGELVNCMKLEAAGVLLHDEGINDFYWRQVTDPKCLLKEDLSGRPSIRDRIAIDRAVERAEPALIKYPDTDALVGDYGDDEGTQQAFSKLFVPLLTRDSTLGLVVLLKSESKDFTKEEIDTIVGLAAFLAVSVENSMYLGDIFGANRKAAGLERMKEKIINRLSHELRTPLAILKGSLKYMEVGLEDLEVQKFNPALARMNRQLENLGRLERQVSSILWTGVYEERDMLSRVLESAASLIELRSEQKPETKFEAALILKILEEAFPDQDKEMKKIDIEEFCESMLEKIRSQIALRGRRLTLALDLVHKAQIRIPGLVLHSTIEGIIRNAVEATPDHGFVEIHGRIDGNFYILTVEDCGIGIPTEDSGLVFDGFYQVQQTEDYTSGRPYSFNAGGKGMDLYRIKMFAKLYGFALYFKSRRCRHLIESLSKCPGDVELCPYCRSSKDCLGFGGTIFEVDFPLAETYSDCQKNCPIG